MEYIVKDETIETTLDENEVAVFKKDWEESSDVFLEELRTTDNMTII